MTEDQGYLETSIFYPTGSDGRGVPVFTWMGFYAGANAGCDRPANYDFNGFVGTFTPDGGALVDVIAPAAGHDERGFCRAFLPRMSLRLPGSPPGATAPLFDQH